MEAICIRKRAPMPAVYGLHATFNESLAGKTVQVGLPATALVLLETGLCPGIVRNKSIPHLSAHLEVRL